jgi:para-nitrobenzyl esterase
MAALIATVGFASQPSAQVPETIAPVVRLDTGRVRGEIVGTVESFKGIPYARPPVGDFRWRAPQPARQWEGVRDASKFGPECMQVDDVPKSEDCLFVNVWRPANAKGAMPVMVWIYGGALVHGQTSLYPADALASQGVIVVSMNYRMNRLGFFAHPDIIGNRSAQRHGNYGYLDQRAALQWVQRNIAAFGGDPKNVTIFGESAGAGSVLVHLTAPLSQGLFHRAILQSPGIPTPRPGIVGLRSFEEAQKLASDYARSVGVSGNGQKARAALRALPAETLIAGTSAKETVAALSADKPLPGVAGSMIDGKLVVDHPSSLIAAGRWAKVPVIIGANDRDLPVGVAASKDDLFRIFGPHAEEARRLYDPNGSGTLEELKQQVFADRTMTEPARHLAELVTAQGQKAWLYRFSYVAESLRGQPGWEGTLHGMEIPYTFNLPAAVVKDKVTTADRAMAVTASGYWTSFGKTGNPNGGGRPEWLPHTKGSTRLLNFTNDGVSFVNDPIRDRLNLWQKVWQQPQ